MSISTIQRKRKIEEFSMGLIQEGVEPNNYELNKMLSEYFDNHVLGMPYYAPKKQIPYEESSKDDYNHNFTTFEEDIKTIYAANIETNNRAVSLQEYYDTEKDKINNSIDKLTQRVDNLIDALRGSVKVQEYVEAFDDLYKIEFYGNKKRNIPATTAFIDLLQKKVHTEKSNAQVNRLSLENAVVKLEGLYKFNGFETSGDLQKILSDSVTDLYIIAGRSEDNSEKTVDIYVDFGQLMTCNSVSFSYTASRAMQCSLAISDNGNDFYSVYDIHSRGHVEWNFTERSVRYIKISCTKPEADGVAQTTNAQFVYEYYYIFKNIQVALEGFQDKSILVTKPITFRNLTSTITLNASDMVFNNTRIDYFIGFDNKTGRVGWDAIENHKEHKLEMFEKHYNIANKGTYGEYGKQSDLTGLYAVFKLPNGTNINSLKVVPGYNAWAVNKYTRLTAENSADFSLQTLDYTDFIKECEYKRMFMDCENYNDFIINTNTLYILTQYVDAPETTSIRDRSIKLMQSTYDGNASNYEMRIFVNGYECTAAETGLYSFRIRKGVNKIQIAIYSPNGESGETNEFKLVHDINFKQITNNVFAFPPMRYTEPSILSRVVEDSYQYYTVKNNIVYVKIDPRDIINKDKQDMGYFLSYFSLKEDMRKYYESDELTFRIMAILNSTDRNMSPAIQSIRVTGK